MKASKYPRFRTVTRKGASGQIWVYYRYDMRGTGKPDVNLGSDHKAALEQWHKLHNHQPLTVGRIQEAIDQWRDRCLPEYENSDTRSSYTRQLARVESWCGQMGWQSVVIPNQNDDHHDRQSDHNQAQQDCVSGDPGHCESIRVRMSDTCRSAFSASS